MDTMNDCMIPECGDLTELKNFRMVVGVKQLRKALENGRAKFVFMAKNADPALTEPLEALCADNHIPITWVRSMTELGHACGIEVGAAAAAVLIS